MSNRVSSKIARETLGFGAMLDIWRCYDRYVSKNSGEDLVDIHIDSKDGLAAITIMNGNYYYGIKSVYEVVGDISIIKLDDTEVMMMTHEVPSIAEVET